MGQQLKPVLFPLLLGVLWFGPVSGANGQPLDALIQMAAGDMDRLLGDIQASTCAVAHAYERLYRSSSVEEASEIQRSPERWIQWDHTIQFNTWDGTSTQPVYQTPRPAYYAYGDIVPGERQFRQLGIFRRLTPVLRASHETFGFSWTYLTTADGMMLLYPFLTIEEAVHNYPPTQQVFYTQADFVHRRAGWTQPYLDLAGAGMMVTVSCPAFDDDTGIGVASNDITLDQLSKRILQRLAGEAGEIAYIVDSNGLVIGVSDPALRQELEDVNREAGRAVLYYGISTPDRKGEVTASSGWINTLTSRLLAEPDARSDGKVMHMETDGRTAWAVGMRYAGWIIVLVSPTRQHELGANQ
jgi:hypothetical protein